MSHIRLFGHQAQRQRFTVNLLPLEVSGTFASVAHGLAYSDYIDILNASGPCSVSLISGTLPPGYSLYVDNATQRVYITWPAVVVSSSIISNGNFGAGNVGWTLGPGWSIVQNDVNADPLTPDSRLIARITTSWFCAGPSLR